MTDYKYIEDMIAANNVILFMKGTPAFPQCGFSARVVQILNHLEVDYHSVNVLDDVHLRDDIKAFANWPTIPQLYVAKQFIGGADIVSEMYKAGELQELLGK